MWTLTFDCNDATGQAAFWRLALGYVEGAPPTGFTSWAEWYDHFDVPAEERDVTAIDDPAGIGPRIGFLPVPESKTVKNRIHLDIRVNKSRTEPAADRWPRVQALVTTLIAAGATVLSEDRLPDGSLDHVVLADPEGNEFCVIEPGNAFLADCGFVGAVACDGSQQVGYFWSAALGWPLVWDQDQETAIRSPHGGPKITWGGPPLTPRTGRGRLRFDLAPAAHHDEADEVGRLVSLGATLVEMGPRDPARLAMADPDGNEFCLLSPR